MIDDRVKNIDASLEKILLEEEVLPLTSKSLTGAGPARKSIPVWYEENTVGNTVRRGSHWDGSSQNRLGDEQTCGMTLASAYVLCLL